VPETRLAKPIAEFPEGYTSLTDLRELPDGRVLVLERCERVVKALDLENGTEKQVGRSGAGPGEYRLPARLLALPGDSTAIHDVGNQRYLVIHPDGTPGRVFSALRGVTTERGGAVISSRFNPVASDGRGRFYARESGIVPGEKGLERADSVAIERWDPASGERDTVAFHDLVGPPGPINPMNSEPPFLTGVQFAVAADGRTALLFPTDYHVEFVSASGQRTKGKAIPFTPERVTDGHKEQWRADQKNPCAPPSGVMSMTMSDGKTVTARMAPTPEPDNWPDVLPPFLRAAPVFASDGMLWVKRTVPADAPASYDVIDRTGSLVHRVILPPRTRLLGFGKGTVYLVRVDEDDLQYVQRYKLALMKL
jgi:hypothetical protein